MTARQPAVRPAAGVAIFDHAGDLLLGLHAHDGRWATFGGAVEAGEDALTAALREVREETGLELKTVHPIGTFGGTPDYTVRYPDGITETYVVTMFGCHIDRAAADVNPDGVEILRTCWFDPRELPGDDILAADMTDIVPAAVTWSDQITRSPRRQSPR